MVRRDAQLANGVGVNDPGESAKLGLMLPAMNFGIADSLTDPRWDDSVSQYQRRLSFINADGFTSCIELRGISP